MNYSQFLFQQLFMNHVSTLETEYQELEYDILFPEVLKHERKYLFSDYNVATKSEYECIQDYLKNNVRKC